jgi:hypothetical protein
LDAPPDQHPADWHWAVDALMPTPRAHAAPARVCTTAKLFLRELRALAAMPFALCELHRTGSQFQLAMCSR